jgi:coenzyme Q-binding protein COQ10
LLVQRPPNVTAVSIFVDKRLPFAPADLHALVSDVRAYPQFIPWVKALTLRMERQDGPAWTGVASALVGWNAFLERFETRVMSKPGTGVIEVSLVSGPFRVLENAWRFRDDGAGGSRVEFRIRYQFKNPILQALAAANRAKAGDRIVAAFEAEARRRYPPAGGSGPSGA